MRKSYGSGFFLISVYSRRGYGFFCLIMGAFSLLLTILWFLKNNSIKPSCHANQKCSVLEHLLVKHLLLFLLRNDARLPERVRQGSLCKISYFRPLARTPTDVTFDLLHLRHSGESPSNLGGLTRLSGSLIGEKKHQKTPSSLGYELPKFGTSASGILYARRQR